MFIGKNYEFEILCENQTNSLKGLFGSKLDDPPPLFPLFFFFFLFYFTLFYYSLSDNSDYFFLDFYLSSA